MLTIAPAISSLQRMMRGSDAWLGWLDIWGERYLI